MGERIVSLNISELSQKRLFELGDFNETANDAILLGIAVEERRVYQKIGGGLQKLRMSDVNPISLPSRLDETFFKLDLSLKSEWEKEISKYSSDLDNWVRRASALVLRLDSFRLYAYKKDGKLARVVLSSKKTS